MIAICRSCRIEIFTHVFPFKLQFNKFLECVAIHHATGPVDLQLNVMLGWLQTDTDLFPVCPFNLSCPLKLQTSCKSLHVHPHQCHLHTCGLVLLLKRKYRNSTGYSNVLPYLHANLLPSILFIISLFYHKIVFTTFFGTYLLMSNCTA